MLGLFLGRSPVELAASRGHTAVMRLQEQWLYGLAYPVGEIVEYCDTSQDGWSRGKIVEKTSDGGIIISTMDSKASLSYISFEELKTLVRKVEVGRGESCDGMDLKKKK